MNVPFLDLNKLNLRHKTEILNKINSIIENGYFIRGNENKLFEEDFSRFLNQKHTIGVANGLDALRLIFRAYIELGRLSVGDEVIVPANTYIASVLAITENGLIPKFLEPDISTYNLDLSKLSPYVSNKTKAVLMVHLYGQVSWDYNAVNELKNKGLIFVEDCAQSVGGNINDTFCGSFGDASGFSFYPGKNLGAWGDGGAITTNNKKLMLKILELRNWGSTKKYIHNSMDFLKCFFN
ncbi:MAG: DegT/DnrJ/EryC1/StrS family aminotransferase, partial [Crocinitomicaceae bacterium]|nr:DegT/DnrJ/EryC1/StrS family aminotransferase [Crocinitomicaceae bacterium]